MAWLTAHAPRQFPMMRCKQVETRLVSLHCFAQMVDVVYTDIPGNASPTLALTNGIGLGVALLWSGKALGKITGN